MKNLENNDIWFGPFHYYIPHNEDEIGAVQHTADTLVLSEVYEGLGFITTKEFLDSSKELHRQLPSIKKVMEEHGFHTSSVEFVLQELRNTCKWLRESTNRTL